MKLRMIAVALAIGVSASRAHAANEGIQVYIDDMSAQGTYGPDVHVGATGAEAAGPFPDSAHDCSSPTKPARPGPTA